MAVQTAAGTKLFIGPVAGSEVDTLQEYEGLAYIEVGEIETFGEFGDQANDVTFTSMGDRRVRHFKGSFDAGQVQLGLGFDITDAGQAAVRAAMATDFDYAVKVTLSDESDDSGAEPSTFYYRAKVMSWRINPQNADSVVRATVTLGINSEIVEVAAT